MNHEIAAINPIYREACQLRALIRLRSKKAPPTPSQVRRAIDAALKDRAARRLKNNREGRIVFYEDFQ